MLRRSFLAKMTFALGLCLLVSQNIFACGTSASISMDQDDAGVSYVVWNNNGATFVNTTDPTTGAWNTSINISASQSSPNDTSSPMVVVSPAGKAIALWIGPLANTYNYLLYSSMYSGGTWLDIVAISGATDALLNGSFEVNLLDTTSSNNVLLTYYAQDDNGNNLLRTASATFGDNSSWTTPVTMP